MLIQLFSLIKSPMMLILFIVLMIFPLLFSLSFHEFAHGWTADKVGDPTAKMMGRLTLNPLKHLDPMGTILLLLIGLGWAKPVIVDMRNIPNRTHQMLVALAGPASNLLLAAICTLIMSILKNYFLLSQDNFILFFFDILVTINLGLAVFNMLPIPPMDGSRVLAWLLPDRLEYEYMKLAPYGMFILIILLYFNGFSIVFQFANLIKMHLYNLLQVIS